MTARPGSRTWLGDGDATKPRSTFTRNVAPWIGSAGRMTAYTLALDTAASWLEFGDWLALRVPLHDRVSIAFAALRSLPDSARQLAVSAAFAADVDPEAAGPPMPPLLHLPIEATDWARFASPEESRAILVAIWRELSAADRRAFSDFMRTSP